MSSKLNYIILTETRKCEEVMEVFVLNHIALHIASFYIRYRTGVL